MVMRGVLCGNIGTVFVCMLMMCIIWHWVVSLCGQDNNCIDNLWSSNCIDNLWSSQCIYKSLTVIATTTITFLLYL